jgi:hypothetical protein
MSRGRRDARRRSRRWRRRRCPPAPPAPSSRRPWSRHRAAGRPRSRCRAARASGCLRSARNGRSARRSCRPSAHHRRRRPSRGSRRPRAPPAPSHAPGRGCVGRAGHARSPCFRAPQSAGPSRERRGRGRGGGSVYCPFATSRLKREPRTKNQEPDRDMTTRRLCGIMPCAEPRTKNRRVVLSVEQRAATIP